MGERKEFEERQLAKEFSSTSSAGWVPETRGGAWWKWLGPCFLDGQLLLVVSPDCSSLQSLSLPDSLSTKDCTETNGPSGPPGNAGDCANGGCISGKNFTQGQIHALPATH